MKSLLALSRIIDTVNRWIGAIIIWFVLAAVLISAGNAVLRKLFNVGSNAYLELQWYLFAAVFLLGAGYTFLRNAHVRIDFVSTRLSPRARNWVDILGIVIFLLPLTVLLIRLSWPLVFNAWVSGEMSQNAGGLVRWPVLALLPAGMALLLAQAISELIKRVAFLRGVGADSIPEEHDPVAASLLAEPSPGEPAR
jgi:TRAP-type mannitol/chloroaromatic compound transport system permease small subunit